MAEGTEFVKFCKFFTLRVGQIVVQSKLGRKFKTDSSAGSQEWFNLALLPQTEVEKELRRALNNSYPPDAESICIDIFLRCCDSDDLVLMETWNISFDKNEIVLGTSVSNYVYHQLSTMIRSVLCASRNTPCYRYFAARQSAETFVLLYAVRHGNPKLHMLGPDFRTIRLGATGSAFGTLSVTVFYRVNSALDARPGSSEFSTGPDRILSSPMGAINIPHGRRTSIGGFSQEKTTSSPLHVGSAPILCGLPVQQQQQQRRIESPDLRYNVSFSTSPSSDRVVVHLTSQGGRSPEHFATDRSGGGIIPRNSSSSRMRPSSRGGGVSGSSTSSESGTASTLHQKQDGGSSGYNLRPDTGAMFGMEMSESPLGKSPPGDESYRSSLAQSPTISSSERKIRQSVTFDVPRYSRDDRENDENRPSSLPFASLLPENPYSPHSYTSSEDTTTEIRPTSLPDRICIDRRASDLATTKSARLASQFAANPVPTGENRPGSSSESNESDDFVKLDDGGSNTRSEHHRPAFARAQSESRTAGLGEFVRSCREAPYVLPSFASETKLRSQSTSGGVQQEAGEPTTTARLSANFDEIVDQLKLFSEQCTSFDQFVKSFGETRENDDSE